MNERNADEFVLAVIERLNGEKKVWTFEVTAHHVFEREVVVLGRLVVDGVAKMSFGAATASREVAGAGASVGSLLQAAANEALARAARLFGVGLVFESRAETSHRVTPHNGGAPAPENRITQRQLGALQGHARRRNLARADVVELLRERFGKSELVTLTRKEASELLTELTEANGHTNA